MQRCIDIAGMGAGRTAPNPMVGCVIVHQSRIIGEGYHIECGKEHAEVNAIRSVKNPNLLPECTLYVSLEPCSHYGKTPPCSDLIIEKKIPHVVIGTTDTFAEVDGRGIEKLRKAGIIVETGVLENECRWLNRRFFTFHQKKRPYIILKWAQSLDGYIDMNRFPGQPPQPNWISNDLARTLVHKGRAQEAAILVGTRTVQLDNPSLTTRHWSGRSPLRVVIDRKGILKGNLKIFNPDAPTLIFTDEEPNLPFASHFKLDSGRDVVTQVLEQLYTRGILSLIVEGGSFTLQQFIYKGLWDEAQIYYGPVIINEGVKAPGLQGEIFEYLQLEGTILSVVLNPAMPYRL